LRAWPPRTLPGGTGGCAVRRWCAVRPRPASSACIGGSTLKCRRLASEV